MITARYKAEHDIHDPGLLESILQSRVQAHVDAIDDPEISDCDLLLEISHFDPNGKCTILLSGQINGRPIEDTLVQVHRPPSPSLWSSKSPRPKAGKEYREHARRNGLALFLVWHVVEFFRSIVRKIFPSETVNAIGTSFFVGNGLKSFDASTADVCHSIDQQIGRDPTNGQQIFWTTLLQTVGVVVVFSLLGGLWFEFSKEAPGKTVIAALLAGGALAASTFASGVLKLPHRYLTVEPAGRAFLRSSGLRSPRILRFFAFILFITSLLMLGAAGFLFFGN
ncbi:hypothetical protein SH661x_002516 [Planctomicrobium sp. SH661]|uniref:hypothetical protein n=1 Tax=Planctomicrobium sp. SH661 TaxID=3448124 RepID=UPI003F5BF074